MADRRIGASSAALPQTADDFTGIRGIGPNMQRRLHNAGILTLAQLSASSPKEIAASVAGLSAKRISRENWIGQARKLALKKTQPKNLQKAMAIWTSRQHYENFTVEFLLDENNEARRTRVVHVQSGQTETWSIWEAKELMDFFALHMGMHPLATESEAQETVKALSQAPAIATTKSIPRVIVSPQPVPPSSPSTAIVGTLHLHDLQVFPVGFDSPSYVLRQDQPFGVYVSLDLKGLVVPSHVSLKYEATIIAKQLGEPNQVLGKAHGTLELTDKATIGVSDISLPPGVYRLNALVKLMLAGHQKGLVASLEGNLLEVN